MRPLDWPAETAHPVTDGDPRFVQVGSNICLDFHGDPARAGLVVLSDGNHHMALHETLAAFVQQHPDVGDIFYCTTPPGVALRFLRAGRIDVANLRLSVLPHVFISPPAVLDQLVGEGRMTSHRPFARSRGVALLVRRGNPKRIDGVAALLRPEVRVFLSNPVNEKVSYDIYARWLRRRAAQAGLAADFLDHPPGRPDPAKLVYGESIHHREAPQAVADGRADVAVVFYHLALRYARVFPEVFEFVRQVPADESDMSRLHCGAIGDGGAWGAAALAFLHGDATAAIYARHGLDPVPA